VTAAEALGSARMADTTPTAPSTPRSSLTLIGQYDSPFVRRVAVALQHYGMAYEHWPWSVWADAARLVEYNPLLRVPVLILEDGTKLIESFAILDALDDRVGPERALLPRSGNERHEGLRICALATGVADKAVILLYEHVLRKPADRNPIWAERCAAQIKGTLQLLESERQRRSSRFWFGSSPSHADIALGCALRFAREAHPELLAASLGPALEAHATRCEALPSFQAVTQPLIVQLD
jgi:glutathione S-transferase